MFFTRLNFNDLGAIGIGARGVWVFFHGPPRSRKASIFWPERPLVPQSPMEKVGGAKLPTFSGGFCGRRGPDPQSRRFPPRKLYWGALGGLPHPRPSGWGGCRPPIPHGGLGVGSPQPGGLGAAAPQE